MPMHQIRIEVELLTHGPVDKDFELAPAAFEIEDDEDFQFPEPVRGKLHAARAGESVLVTGELRTRALCTCSRCLEEVVLDLRVPFRLGFIPQDPSYPITDPEEAAAGKGNVEHGYSYGCRAGAVPESLSKMGDV